MCVCGGGGGRDGGDKTCTYAHCIWNLNHLFQLELLLPPHLSPTPLNHPQSRVPMDSLFVSLTPYHPHPHTYPHTHPSTRTNTHTHSHTRSHAHEHTDTHCRRINPYIKKQTSKQTGSKQANKKAAAATATTKLLANQNWWKYDERSYGQSCEEWALKSLAYKHTHKKT